MKQNDLLKFNAQRRKDYQKLRWRWTEKVRKGEIHRLLHMTPTKKLNHKYWSSIRRISGLIKLEEKTVSNLEK